MEQHLSRLKASAHTKHTIPVIYFLEDLISHGDFYVSLIMFRKAIKPSAKFKAKWNGTSVSCRQVDSKLIADLFS